MRVVHDVTEELRGRNVMCDSIFTPYELKKWLLKRKKTLVGMIQKNKSKLLPVLLAFLKERKVLSSRFAFTHNSTLVSYLLKKTRTWYF